MARQALATGCTAPLIRAMAMGLLGRVLMRRAAPALPAAPVWWRVGASATRIAQPTVATESTPSPVAEGPEDMTAWEVTSPGEETLGLGTLRQGTATESTFTPEPAMPGNFSVMSTSSAIS